MADSRETNNYIYSDLTGSLFADDLFYALNKNLWNILTSQSINTYVVTGVEPSTLTYLSEKIYSTIDFWWILGMINGIDNNLFTLPKGRILYYPNKDDIAFYLKQSNAIQSTSPYSVPKSNKYVNGLFTF